MIVHFRKHSAFAKALEPYGIKRVSERKRRTVDFNSTVFTFYPDKDRVVNAPDWYEKVRVFTRSNKASQRKVLGGFFSVPRDFTEVEPPYVVRPLVHWGGQHFYIANNHEEIADISRQIGYNVYASELFERDKEYRHLFIGGNHIVTLFKKTDEDAPQDQPWNHTFGSVFRTVTRDINDKLLKTTFYADAKKFFEEYPIDVVAIDTAWHRESKKYVVFEVNIAPRVEIETTLDKIAEAINNIRQT